LFTNKKGAIMTWRKRTIMEMAREAGFEEGIAEFIGLTNFYAFAKLVREEATAEANARANASWTLMCEKMVAIEREACAKVCDALHYKVDAYGATCAAAIRERGQA